MECEAMSLSHRPDLNLEPGGREAPPCSVAVPSTEYSADPEVQDVLFPVPWASVPLLPPACAFFKSFPPVRLPCRTEKGAVAPSPGWRHPNIPPKQKPLAEKRWVLTALGPCPRTHILAPSNP